MTDALERAFQELRRDYLAEAPGRLAEIRKDIGAFLAGEPDAAESLRTRFHRLAGSGGSYGFPRISELAREVEQWISSDPSPDAESEMRLGTAIRELGEAFDAEAAAMGPPDDSERQQRFGWRVSIDTSSETLRFQVADELRAAGFAVHERADPSELVTLPPCDRPDIVVVGADPGRDAAAAAAAWAGDRRRRPRGVVVVEGATAVNQLDVIAAGADLIIPRDQIEDELPRYCRSLARLGALPVSVLYVERDAERGRRIRVMLEDAGVSVEQVGGIDDAPDALARAVPDVLLIAEPEDESAGRGLARMVRHDARTRLVPVIILSENTQTAARIESLRVGVDDLLPLTADAELVLRTVLARGNRARQLSELVHRDPLTGLLNFTTLRSELEHAAAYARRYNDRFALLLADVDHFRRINERHGHSVGDRVLIHVATIFRSVVRASDLLGRHGGEEFGMILRGSDREGAAIAAEKLREALRARPFTTRGGGIIPLHVSIGIASYGQDGGSAGELAHAADRALHQAKTAGRDRVGFAG